MTDPDNAVSAIRPDMVLELEKLELWFFRDLSDEQRLKLFALYGMPVDEIGNVHGRQRPALRRVVNALSALSPAFIERIGALERENARLLQSGCWTASIYHCPPPARKNDNPLRHSATIRVTGTFATEAEALAKAKAVIKDGRPTIDIFIHRPTAEASADFHVSQDALNAFARSAIQEPTKVEDGERQGDEG